MERSKKNWEMPVATFEKMVGAREEIRRLEAENNLLKRQILSAQEQIRTLKRNQRGK